MHYETDNQPFTTPCETGTSMLCSWLMANLCNACVSTFDKSLTSTSFKFSVLPESDSHSQRPWGTHKICNQYESIMCLHCKTKFNLEKFMLLGDKQVYVLFRPYKFNLTNSETVDGLQK